MENTRKKGGLMPLFIANLISSGEEQLVQLPKEAHFSCASSTVWVKIRGRELVITNFKNNWDQFFLEGQNVSDDFFNER